MSFFFLFVSVQYKNKWNAIAHYDTTGEEILTQTDGNFLSSLLTSTCLSHTSTLSTCLSHTSTSITH